MILSKEELERECPKEELDKRTKTIAVRVSFEVTCDSSPYIFKENSIAKRIREYIFDCTDAMDNSMRSWGDHVHCIDPVKVVISDINTEEEQDITEEVLGDEAV